MAIAKMQRAINSRMQIRARDRECVETKPARDGR